MAQDLKGFKPSNDIMEAQAQIEPFCQVLVPGGLSGQVISQG